MRQGKALKKVKKLLRKPAALALAVMMCASLLSVSALAEEEVPENEEEVVIQMMDDEEAKTISEEEIVPDEAEIEAADVDGETETETAKPEPEEEEDYGIQTLADQGTWTVGPNYTYKTIDELNDALAALADGDSVTVQMNAAMNGCLVIPAGITVTLRLSNGTSGSGYTLSNEGYEGHTITNYGTLTIENYAGSVESVVDGYAALYNASGATVTQIRTRGTITASGYYTIVNQGSITISGNLTTFDNTSEDYSTFLNGYTDDENNDEGNIANLTISSTSAGTYNGGKYCIENTSSGNLKISGGTFTSEDEDGGCILDSGTTTISGGTFNAPGPVIKAEETAVIDITGGTFTSTDGVTDPVEIARGAEVTISSKATFSPEHVDPEYGDPVAEVKSTGEQYASIKSAIEAATDNDTVTLLADVTVDVGSDAYVTVSKDITMDLGEFTITVNGTSSGGSLFNVSTGVTFTLTNGTIDGGTGEGDEKTASADVYAIRADNDATVNLSEVTIQYFNRASGGAVSVSGNGTEISVDGCSFIGNCRAITCSNGTISNSSFTNNGVSDSTDSGAAVYVMTYTGIEITGCTFDGNVVKNQGGAVYAASATTAGDEADISITGNTFTNNSANYGGAIYIGSVHGELAVTGNTISNNSAGNGGGIYFVSSYSGSVTSDYDFSNNTVTGNSATQRGGGMTLTGASDREIAIRSGIIADNYAGEYGGGIDHTADVNSTLRLYNALITDNSAYRGGGFWACPSAVTNMHMVFGGAIYGNTASGDSGSTGDSIRFEGQDSDFNDSEGGVFVTVSPRALGGGLEDWYADDIGDRYTDGAEPVDVTDEKYNNTNLSFGLHGELTGTSLELAEAEATLYIYDNKTEGYGGGVASNSVVDLGGIPGEEPGDEYVNVEAEKVWVNENGETISDHADSIEVTLVRVDGENKQDLETVTISEETDWCWEFKDLPAYYMEVAEDGINYEIHSYTYELRETAVKGYDTEYSDPQKDEDGNIVITITNVTNREYYDIDEEIVTDEDDIFNKDAWVKNESVNEYNAIEIEMTTSLPTVTVDDLATGEFTMNFHEVLDHELVLDEDTADFSVYIAETQISTAYYKITFDDDTGDDCNFHVDVDLTALYNDGVVTEDMLDGNTEITIFFFADLEGTGLNGSYTSTVWYEIYDGEELQYTSNVDVVAVYTYEILINKVDSETNEPLEGAVFGIYYDEDCNEDSAVSRNNEPYTVVSEDNGEAIFYGLAEGTYYVKELQAPTDYRLSDTVLTIELSDETADEDHIFHDTFENELETIDISGSKAWNDNDNQDGYRPESITIYLLADGEVTDSVVVTETDDWSYSFTDLPMYKNGVEISYTIIEDAVDHYGTEYDGYNVVNNHTLDQTSVSVTKAWDDAGDQDGIRPESVTVQLYADGEAVEGATLTLDKSNNWTGSFTGLDIFHDHGERVVYTIEEVDVPDGYECTVEAIGDSSYAYAATNKHTPETIDISGNKTWDDNENKDGVRPESITIRLLADGEEVDSITVTEAEEWAWSFADLPKDKEGTEIDYTITEDAVDGYESEINGYDVINTLQETEPEIRDISGSKTWDDDDDKADARPESITVNLYQNNELYDSLIVTEADDWTWSWTGLPKTDENGEDYAYTIDEDEVEYYAPTYREGSFDITNTFVGEEGAEHPTSGPEKGGDTPKTGDNSNIALWLALLVAALACIVVGLRMRKRS